MSCERLFAQGLKARGLRLTPQREMVLAALHTFGGHASVQEIHRRVQLKSESVERSTVYRTLELLRDMGLVIEVDMGDNVLRYELTVHGPHAHLVCTRCGHVATLDLAELGPLREHLACRI
mgnify:CR=1 FL=1